MIGPLIWYQCNCIHHNFQEILNFIFENVLLIPGFGHKVELGPGHLSWSTKLSVIADHDDTVQGSKDYKYNSKEV